MAGRDHAGPTFGKPFPPVNLGSSVWSLLHAGHTPGHEGVTGRQAARLPRGAVTVWEDGWECGVGRG